MILIKIWLICKLGIASIILASYGSIIMKFDGVGVVWGLRRCFAAFFSGGKKVVVCGWRRWGRRGDGVSLIVEPQRADVIVFGSATPREFVSGKRVMPWYSASIFEQVCRIGFILFSRKSSQNRFFYGKIRTILDASVQCDEFLTISIFYFERNTILFKQYWKWIIILSKYK